MKFTILIPHWKTGKMTAYTVAQLMKFKGRHEIDIIVIDNNAGDGSTEYLQPLFENLTIVDYPKEKMQSHGIAFDFILPHIQTEEFITIESDAFPTEDGWLDAYEKFILDGIDCTGSILKLSGGTYLHPCGALYKTDSWWEAKKFCDEIHYDYFPNMAPKDGFDCHLMVHKSIVDQFLSDPEEYIDIAKKYKPYSREETEKKREEYAPTRNPFHNGMGATEESIHTYGGRTIASEAFSINLDKARKIVRRIGFEPGQWFCYWHYLMKKKVHPIRTETKWINDQPGTQQEYTITEHGFKHLWGISAWKDGDPNHEYAKIKQPIPDQLYETLPAHQKITQS